MKKQECPILSCREFFTFELPHGCKKFPDCDMFKNLLRDYCLKKAKIKINPNKIKHNKIYILNCTMCKYNQLCIRNNLHNKAIREKYGISVEFI